MARPVAGGSASFRRRCSRSPFLAASACPGAFTLWPSCSGSPIRCPALTILVCDWEAPLYTRASRLECALDLSPAPACARAVPAAERLPSAAAICTQPPPCWSSPSLPSAVRNAIVIVMVMVAVIMMRAIQSSPAALESASTQPDCLFCPAALASSSLACGRPGTWSAWPQAGHSKEWMMNHTAGQLQAGPGLSAGARSCTAAGAPNLRRSAVPHVAVSSRGSRALLALCCDGRRPSVRTALWLSP